MSVVPASSSQLKFFVDRSLGKEVPQLLREAGFDLITLDEYYGDSEGQSVKDETWLQMAGENGWPVLTADTRIRYRASEKEALIDSKVRLFVLPSKKDLTADEEAERFITHKNAIENKCAKEGPFVISVTQKGLLVREI